MKYILFGTQALEFPDLRVEPTPEGTLFEYELDPAKELSLSHCIKRADVEPLPEVKSGRKVKE